MRRNGLAISLTTSLGTAAGKPSENFSHTIPLSTKWHSDTMWQGRIIWKRTYPVSLSARARLRYCGLCLLFITAPSSLYMQRHLLQPDYNVIAIYPTTARSANPGHGAGARHDRVQSHCNGTRYVCRLSIHSRIAVCGGVAMRKSTKRSLFVNNFQIDWVRLNVPPTHYRSYGDGFLRVKWPNQQCQSTEGR